MVDASSAVFLKKSSPSNTILVQGPGLHFTNNRRILGTVDLRRQFRVRKSVRGFSRDGIEVQTNVATVFTIGEKPDVLPVCYDGAEIPANLRVIHLRTEGLSQFITELVDELEADDKVDIHNFILANMDPMGPYNLPPEIVPGPPYTIDETRIFAAVSSRAQNVAEKNILDWTELPVYAAVGLFRNMLAQELYDNLYLPKEPETYPLAYMKGNFSIKVRNLGILSYQYVKREDGEKLAPGQIWNPAALNSYPAQNLQSPKVLRARGIKGDFCRIFRSGADQR